MIDLLLDFFGVVGFLPFNFFLEFRDLFKVSITLGKGVGKFLLKLSHPGL